MIEDEGDFLIVEDISEDDDDIGEPVFVINQHDNGDVSFATQLRGPKEALWLIKQIEFKLLEDCIGKCPRD